MLIMFPIIRVGFAMLRKSAAGWSCHAPFGQLGLCNDNITQSLWNYWPLKTLAGSSSCWQNRVLNTMSHHFSWCVNSSSGSLCLHGFDSPSCFWNFWMCYLLFWSFVYVCCLRHALFPSPPLHPGWNMLRLLLASSAIAQSSSSGSTHPCSRSVFSTTSKGRLYVQFQWSNC